MPNEINVEPQEKKISFGDGRYSSAMKELYQDSQRLLKITPKQAERLARSYGAELGRFNATPKISFGRLTKDYKITLKESSLIKGVSLTYAIALARLCVTLQECFTFGIEEFVEISLKENHLKWLNADKE